ncbi:MAG: transcription termination/antitermination protein NusG [Candidatus Peribacteria bacterium]|jgi:transcriptional antiterminator NusG|nr:transcription termination/antitermination protein NusG [Candidatus Peribacteria bacterium]
MQETNTVEIKKQIEDRSFKRYVLSVTSGQEDLVVENLKERINKQGLKDDVVEFLNPKINETSIKKGEKIVKQKKLYPGYLFFKSRMNDRIWYVVRNTPGVRLIVGADTKPVPVSENEYQDIMNQIAQSQERSELRVPYKAGEVVLLKTGDFKGMQGTIKEVDADKGQVVVQVEMLGRLTPVLIDVDKIELL